VISAFVFFFLWVDCSLVSVRYGTRTMEPVAQSRAAITFCGILYQLTAYGHHMLCQFVPAID
jgi:hypothetical protein